MFAEFSSPTPALRDNPDNKKESAGRAEGAAASVAWLPP